MSSPWRIVVFTAAAAILGSGCGTGPPGAGMTNAEPPVMGGSEKAAERTDLPVPTRSDGDAPLADSAALQPGASATPNPPEKAGGPANQTTAPAQDGSPTTPK